MQNTTINAFRGKHMMKSGLLLRTARRSLLLLLGFLCALNSLAVVSTVDSLLSEFLVDGGVLELGGEWLNLASFGGGWKSEDTLVGVLTGFLELISGGVVDLSLLWSVSSLWEKNELGLILVQSFNVGGHGVGILVMSSVVNSDSNGSSESLGQTGLTEFLKREASTELDFVCISSSLPEYNWSKLANWSGSKSSCFGGSLLSSQLFVSWLVEEALHSVLPMLSQMSALEDIIVFYHVAY
jgi:hypothetical protein